MVTSAAEIVACDEEFHPNPKVSAFFVDGREGLDFISLCNNKTSPRSPTEPLSFTPDPDNIRILQSRNGLLLCEPKSNIEYYGFNPSATESEPSNIYYVVNPKTRQCSELTLPSAPTKSRRYIIRLYVDLAFDPSKSLHYKVFVIGQRAIFSDFYKCIWIYSSETRSWRLHEPTGTGEGWPDLIASDGGPVLCNGTINWMDFWTGSFDHYDIEKDSFRTVLGLETKKYQKQYFMESCGYLNLILIHSYSQFDVLEMKRDYSGWFIKYSGDFHPMYSEMVRNDPSLGKYSPCCPFSIFFLAREENEENSYLLLQIPGKAYNLRDKSLEKLCDLTPECYETSHWDVGWAHVYPHMETLACV